MRDIYHNRLVWLRCARLLLKEEALAPQTFYLDNMTVPELRTFATRPQRLCHAILRGEDDLALLSDSYSLSYFSQEARAELTPWRFDPILLPGGRWLLDWGEDLHNTPYVFCWDLWSADSDDCYPVAELASKLDTVKSWSQQAHEDPNRVTILVNGTDSRDNWFVSLAFADLSARLLTQTIFVLTGGVTYYSSSGRLKKNRLSSQQPLLYL